MRDKINSAMKQAMRDKEALRLSTLRLVMAAKIGRASCRERV